MTQHPRPLQHFFAAKKLYPNMFNAVDMYRKSRGVKFPAWPAWCFIPMAGWYEIVREGNNYLSPRLPPELTLDVSRLAAVGTWCYGQGVYLFEKPLLEALTKYPLEGEIPSDVLLRLPEFCIYVSLEDKSINEFGHVYGFFAHLENDANHNRRELRILIDSIDGLFPISLHLENHNIREMIDKSFLFASKKAELEIDFNNHLYLSHIKTFSKDVSKLVSLLLYICSEEPDIINEREPGTSPHRARARKAGKTWRLDVAKKIKIWNVGKEISRRLTVSIVDNSDTLSERTVSPHIRRAHWHGFWTGPRDGERRFIYKWIPPTVISGKEKESELTNGNI